MCVNRCMLHIAKVPQLLGTRQTKDLSFYTRLCSLPEMRQTGNDF